MGEIRKFCIFVISYGRPEFCKNYTMRMLQKYNTDAPAYVVCSDDDPKVAEYRETFGNSNVIVFNKNYVENRYGFDLCDAYHQYDSIKKGTVWVRNVLFEVARELGYRYFVVLDDDYSMIRFRFKAYLNGKEILCSRAEVIPGQLDLLCEHEFRVLDSAPFLNSVALAQGGDYIGGVGCTMFRRTYTMKAMNAFFCDTEKAFQFTGRMNDDVNAYVLHGSRGGLSLTLGGTCVDQVTTQSRSGGMTDIYRAFGTWLKSMYSVVQVPSAVTINTMGNKSESFRIHHNVDWTYCVPKILSSRYAKGKCLDYLTEVMSDRVKLTSSGIESEPTSDILSDDFIEPDPNDAYFEGNTLLTFLG